VGGLAGRLQLAVQETECGCVPAGGWEGRLWHLWRPFRSLEVEEAAAGRSVLRCAGHNHFLLVVCALEQQAPGCSGMHCALERRRKRIRRQIRALALPVREKV
jgi:hypothetical protein